LRELERTSSDDGVSAWEVAMESGRELCRVRSKLMMLARQGKIEGHIGTRLNALNRPYQVTLFKAKQTDPRARPRSR